MSTLVARYRARTVSAESLAYVRILFGAVICFGWLRYLLLGWFDDQYLVPRYHFPYEGFEWLVSLGSPTMEVLYGVMGVAAFGVVLGAFYKTSAITFAALFTYFDLIDKTLYLNHYYAIVVFAWMLCLVPAANVLSVDALRKRNTKLLPAWMIDMFKLQIGIIYLYAGLAKINTEWLINAMPLKIWLPAQSDLPLVGGLLTMSWTAHVASWCGMLFDISIPFLLLYKPTRVWAYAAVIFFHGITGLLFPIGVFPVMMILMTLVFFLPTKAPSQQHNTLPTFNTRFKLCVAIAVAQLLIPWRFLLYPGQLNWTEQGYRFSWRVMLVEKSGSAEFKVTDSKTGRSGIVNNAEFLTEQQERMMSYQPDMIVQYAQLLATHYASRGVHQPQVTADVWVRMNSESSKRLVSPLTDLSKLNTGLHHYDWVLSRD